MHMKRLVVVLLLGIVIGCAGRGPRGPIYEIYDAARHAKFEAGPVIQVVMDSCQPVRVELIEDKGTPVGRLLDSVLCEGVHTFACSRAMRIRKQGERLDTLSREVYFYKVFTPTATKIETILKKKGASTSEYAEGDAQNCAG